MAKVEGKQFLLEQQICEALGLDPEEVYSITLRFIAGAVAQAEVVLYSNKEHLELFVPIIKQYKLVPKEDEEVLSKKE